MSQSPLPLGAFSISLSVKDLAASESFYTKLGFSRAGGDPAQNFLMMRNGETVIGLFHGMFEENLLTFNPGWNQQAEPVDPFVDVRDIQKRLQADGMPFEEQADESTTGPASFVLTDPDGNVILVDQHR